jgi:cytochrome b6-f complex iron-sulfur subunit
VDASAVLIIAIPVLLVLAAVMVLGTARRRAATGRLSWETRASDRSEAGEPGTELARTEDDLDAEARARAAAAGQAASPVPAGARTPAERVPVDEEELGVTRRQFFNRGILTGVGISVGAFGVASLAFLWPREAEGFGGKITVGSIDAIETAFGDKLPFYNAEARTYIVAYPSEDIGKAEAVYDPAIVAGMEEGYVALYQKCVHLGCRVPFCETSQWFECPCHGSKYNRVGEKRGGPAPRGLDRFPLSVSGDSVTVDTGIVVIGPPIGTDTTGQGAEGAPCV